MMPSSLPSSTCKIAAYATGAAFLLVRTAVATEPLFVLEDSKATFFYDTDAANSRCAGRGGGGDGTLSNVPNCENNGPTIGELNTNRIVALNETLLKGDMDAWCGKEVKIYQEGQEVVFDEPLVVWGTCGACSTGSIVDLSVDAYLKLMPGEDCMSNNGNNPEGLRVEIVDNQIWEPAPGSESYSPMPATKLHTGGGYNGPRGTGTVVPPWKDGPVTGGAAVAGSPASATAASSQPPKAVSSAGKTPVISSASAAVATATAGGAGGVGGAGNSASASTRAGVVNLALDNGNSGTGSGQGEACTKGQRQCVGTELQICNYISNDASGLQWTTLSQCPGGCDISKQPDCFQ
ncbi:hypothetical protein IAU59_006900 [Kwoniella sp. CBS 9459]